MRSIGAAKISEKLKSNKLVARENAKIKFQWYHSISSNMAMI